MWDYRSFGRRVLSSSEFPYLSPRNAARQTDVFLSRLSGLMIELTIEIRTPQTPTAPAPSLLSVSVAALRFLSVSTLRAEKAASQGSLPTQQTGLRTADRELRTANGAPSGDSGWKPSPVAGPEADS